MMPAPDKKFWFPAKTHGWGWGPPCAWQGWVVVVVYFLMLITSAFVLVARAPVTFVIHAIILNAALFLICWRKGEKVRWRWGKD